MIFWLFSRFWLWWLSYGRRHGVILDRFWDKVIEAGPDDCWEWTAGKIRGYGQFSLDGHTRIFAHRFAYELLVGPIPDGLQLDHLCRNPPCVNPAHLEAVTGKENNRRSTSPTALNSVKTHCVRGHPLTSNNVYVRPSRPDRRECAICKKLAEKGWPA